MENIELQFTEMVKEYRKTIYTVCYFFSKGDLPNNSFYLHLCYKDNQVARDQLLFQKIEKTDATVFNNYMHMKYLAAAAFSEDRTMYRALKGTLIDTVLHLYREMNPAFEDGEEV